jgi:hypothetical protein
LPGECTKVTCEDGKWFLFYGENDQYTTEIQGEPQWHKDNLKIKGILGELRPAWQMYREIVQCGRIEEATKMEANIKEVIEKQKDSNVCKILSDVATIRYEAQRRSSESHGALAGSFDNMATLWATTRDLAGKRLEILNNAS